MINKQSNIICLKVFAFLAFAMLLIAVPASAQGATYVGKDACKSCHQTEYSKIQNSIHQKMIREASIPGNVHGNLSDPNAPKLSQITYVIGGWYKEESYIKKDGNKYNVTKYEWDPINQHYVNNRSIRNWLVQCAGCHTTGYNTTTQTFKELNIGCEACHGPGSKHVTTGNKSEIVIDNSSEGCGFCHIRATQVDGEYNFPVGYILGKPETLKYNPEPYTNNASFFPDQTTKRHREQYLDVKTSKHYTAGTTCVSCHSPHDAGTVTVYPVSDLPAEFADRSVAMFEGGKVTGYSAWNGAGLKMPKESLCKSCHGGVSEYHIHNFTDAARKAAITCTDCHMPDVINTNSKLRGALTTHNFKSLSPENSIKYGADVMPNSCTYRCHQDKGADKTARASWAISAMSPAPAATTTASATATKAPAFELIFAVAALFIATLARRR
jgi:Cytochrome c554 and c-prime